MSIQLSKKPPKPLPIASSKIEQEQKLDQFYKDHPEKVRPLKLKHEFIPALEYCDWIPSSTKKERLTKAKVQECYPYCCFNHLIGLPTIKYMDEYGNLQGESRPVPLWRYEQNMIQRYEATHYYAQNKCRGAGTSEIITVRHMLYKYATTRMIDRKCLIIAGTNEQAAVVIMHRIKMLADKIPFIYRIPPRSDYPTELFFQKGIIMALAANPDIVRSYENVGDVIYEESAFWKLINDEPVLIAGEPHVIKSSAHIGILSTPKGQAGFFWTKCFDPEIKSKYDLHTLNWTEVVDVKIPIISVEKVLELKEKDLATYEQEMNNQFLLSESRAFGDFTEEDYEPVEI